MNIENAAAHSPPISFAWSGFENIQMNEMVEETYSLAEFDRQVMRSTSLTWKASC